MREGSENVPGGKLANGGNFEKTPSGGVRVVWTRRPIQGLGRGEGGWGGGKALGPGVCGTQLLPLSTTTMGCVFVRSSPPPTPVLTQHVKLQLGGEGRCF